MTFRVRLTREAEADLDRLFDFIVERELGRASPDFALADAALQAIRAGIATLRSSPFTCRKAAANTSFVRELVIPFGHTGDVALFEIRDRTEVVVAAVRHQREDDFH